MPCHRSLTLLSLCLLAACSSAPTTRKPDSPKELAKAIANATGSASDSVLTNQVIATEQAFAKSMANHDTQAFLGFLSTDAVFFSGSAIAHGPAEIVQQWERYIKTRPAPFSWAPDHVEVLASGNLALSTGPVYSDGRVIGRFDSVWRLEGPNSWKIVFDKGEAVCSGLNTP